ncbi:MAG: T9SS type A sorting domain-containing protein [Melioribacteraceae bacterium]|nr:T9SS type A sorting domain-containing protein [Melioribacteraceae bacterium]
MKKLILLLVFLLNVSASIYSQPVQNTFNKTYHFSNEGITGTQIIDAGDDHYLIVGLHYIDMFTTDLIRLCLVDEFGTIITQKEFASYSPETKIFRPVLKTDDGFVFVNNIGDENNRQMQGVVLDNDLNILWTIEADPQESDELISSIINTDEGDYIVASESQNNLYVYKMDSNSTPISTNVFPIPIRNRTRAEIIRFKNNSYLIRSANKIVNIDADLNELWSITPNFLTHTICTLDDEKFVVGGDSNLRCYNADGTEVWNTNLSGFKSITTVTPSAGANIAAGSELDFNLFNENGELIKTETTKFAHTASRTIGNFILFAGKQNAALSIKKTTPDLLYTTVDLTKINNYYRNTYLLLEDFFAFHETRINFETDLEFVNIDYSPDNGATWKEIITYFPAEQNYFNWTVPGEITEECLLKIYSPTEPSLFDILDKPIPIIMYNEYEYIAANEVFMWVGNNGDGSHDPRTDGSGFYWPGGEDAVLPAIFQDGLLFGGKIDGSIWVNGNTHRAGLVPGAILEDGNPDNPLQSKYKVYKYKKSWGLLPPGIDRDKFIYNIQNWPVEIGAPFLDKDFDGIYTPFVDEPGNGADEFLFFIANSADSIACPFTYGSPPYPLEIQVSVWGYDTNDLLKDVVFKKYKLINKGESSIDDMILGYWTDDDLGNANDDYVGVDTSLNLGFTYNGDEDDMDFYDPPAAVAHLMVQGPAVESAVIDSGYFNNSWKTGIKNLPATGFAFFIGGSSIYRDPRQSDYEGTLEVYNYLQGKVWNGEPFIDPNTGLETKFCVPGDPVEGIGWYEGDGWEGGPYPGDRRYLLSSGKFNLASGDTQEVAYALYMAQDQDRLSSLKKLKNLAEQVQHYYYYGELITSAEEKEIIPAKFELKQNYPNPFNPTTTIEYTIPQIVNNQSLSVKLIIYDILGREAATLVNETQSPGNYKVNFDASKLSSGVYLYSLKAGEFMQTRKMILLR